MKWPKLSIVTPSFNQAPFLERTIKSVLGQEYPNLEYIVIDGGSTDGSVEILQRYATQLAYWVSEPDRGQSHALNKGFAQATGAVVGWLNSDDLYCVGALQHVGKWFAEHPTDDVHYGGLYFVDEADRITDAHWACKPQPAYAYFVGMDVHQQALFWRRELMTRIGNIDESLKFSMDLDFVLRLMLAGKVSRTKRYLGMFREHAGAKTATMLAQSELENQLVFARYRAQYSPLQISGRQRRTSLQIERAVQLLLDAPLPYLLFKLGRRAGLPVPVRWLET